MLSTPRTYGNSQLNTAPQSLLVDAFDVETSHLILSLLIHTVLLSNRILDDVQVVVIQKSGKL